MVRAAFICSVVVAALMPVAAHADDPRDTSMRSAAARARDSEETRQLNLQASGAIRQRGLHYEQRQSVDGGYEVDNAQYAAASRDHDRDMDRYARNRAQYERQMADWRRAVVACRAGYYDACDN